MVTRPSLLISLLVSCFLALAPTQVLCFRLPGQLSAALRLPLPRRTAPRQSERDQVRTQSTVPQPPLWAPTFQANFSEENYVLWYTLKTAGVYFYDWANNRERVERASGLGDRYCGSAMPGYDTPCTHLVVDGQRYLIFDKMKYCCKCCSSEHGCGVLRPDWLANATFLGHDYIFGIMVSKWNAPGLQNNYYWHSYDNVPVRIYQEPVTQMTFEHSSYSTPSAFDDTLFTIPESLDCSTSCYGFCALLGK